MDKFEALETSKTINNEEELKEELEKYEKEGNIEMLHDIGWYYDKILKDESTAAKYYELNMNAQGPSYKLSIYNLAHILRFKDRERSRELFEKIIPEDLDALYILGASYQWTNPEKTLEYWNEAISRGDARTTCELAKAYTRSYKPFGNEPEKALELYFKAAEELKYEKAWIYISDFYREDIGTIKDIKKEVEYLLKAPEELLDQTHLFNLGFHYVKGSGGIDRDYENGMRIFKGLDEKYNDKDAQYMIGDLYARGHGVKLDKKEANAWFKKSARNLDMAACKRLLEMDDLPEEEYHEFFELLLKSRNKYYYEKQRDLLGSSIKIKYNCLDTMYQEMCNLRKKVEEYELRPPLIGGELFRKARERFNVITKDHLN